MSYTSSYKPLPTFWEDGALRFYKNRSAMVALFVLFLLLLFSFLVPIFSSYTYYTTSLANKNLMPCREHLFGTDELGRSILVRTAFGARISLLIGFSAAFIDMVVGIFYGGFAALRGGKIEQILMRFADILHSLPYLLVVILLTIILEQGILTIILAMACTGWINMARIVRSQIISLQEQDFITAMRTLGASDSRLLFKHLLPNCFGPIATTVTLSIPHAIFTEAFLSFLGLGVRAPVASWGAMVNDALPALTFYPHRLFFPALFISITMLVFNIIGDGLCDAFDPRLRK
jgi:oligopeptide transport system permease protein